MYTPRSLDLSCSTSKRQKKVYIDRKQSMLMKEALHNLYLHLLLFKFMVCILKQNRRIHQASSCVLTGGDANRSNIIERNIIGIFELQQIGE